MVSKRVKDWLCRQVWRHAGISANHSQLVDPYVVEQLDPLDIFLYQVDHPPFTLFHFVAHMVIMRNTLLWEHYRYHRHWVFTQQRRHVPTLGRLFKQWLIVLICSGSKAQWPYIKLNRRLDCFFPSLKKGSCVRARRIFFVFSLVRGCWMIKKSGVYMDFLL